MCVTSEWARVEAVQERHRNHFTRNARATQGNRLRSRGLVVLPSPYLGAQHFCQWGVSKGGTQTGCSKRGGQNEEREGAGSMVVHVSSLHMTHFVS